MLLLFVNERLDDLMSICPSSRRLANSVTAVEQLRIFVGAKPSLCFETRRNAFPNLGFDGAVRNAGDPQESHLPFVRHLPLVVLVHGTRRRGRDMGRGTAAALK